MRDLPALAGDVEELDGRGLCRRSPGSSTVTRTRASPAIASSEFALRAAGASYEELHARGRRDPLDGARDARGERGGARRAARASTSTGCAARARRPSRRSPATGSTARRSSRSSARSRPPAGSPTWLGAHAAAARVRRRRRVPRLPPRGGAARSGADRRGGGRLPRARRVRRRAGAPLPDGVPRRRARAPSARRPVHGGRSDPARDGARRALGRPPRGDRGGRASGRSRRATSRAFCLPASALFLDRPMPPARALVEAGAAVALATDFNPGSAFCESLPLVCSLAARSSACPPRGARGLHRERRARARPRRPKGRLAPGLRRGRRPARRAEDWRHLAYHLGGAVVHTVIAGGGSPGSARHNRPGWRQEAATPAREGAARLRVRLGRRLGQGVDPPERSARKGRRAAVGVAQGPQAAVVATELPSAERSSRRSCSAPCSCCRRTCRSRRRSRRP